LFISLQLAWHPTNERWLAYGTSEGRVGIYDVLSGKQPIQFRPFHQHSVYVLCWGPPVHKKGMCLYRFQWGKWPSITVVNKVILYIGYYTFVPSVVGMEFLTF